MRVTAATLLLLAAAGACSPSVPAEPTWLDDVRPILAANCIRCHSPPYIGGAPVSFRLDIYGDDRFLVPYPDAGPRPDAGPLPDASPDAPDAGPDASPPGPATVRGAVYASMDGTLAGIVEDEIMPPEFPLTGRQKDVLAKWHEASEPRGEARPGNAEPTMTTVGDLEVIPGRVTLSYEITDADGDIVTGVIVADPGGGEAPIVATNELFVGRGAVRFSLPAGTFDLTAEIDDGQVDAPVTVEIGQVVVP